MGKKVTAICRTDREPLVFRREIKQFTCSAINNHVWSNPLVRLKSVLLTQPLVRRRQNVMRLYQV